MSFIANLYPKLMTPKYVVRKISKEFRFLVPFDKQHGKRTQILFKFARRHLYHIHWSVQRIFSLKKLLLVLWKIFRLFVHTFTTDDKYSLLNRDNLTQSIQMQLSEKLKLFPSFFGAVLKSRLNFEHFQKKFDPYS